MMRFRLAFLLLSASLPVAAETRALKADDLFSVRDVDDPRLSPDGQWVAYTVRTDSLEKDKSDTDVWMAPLAGGEAVRVTSSEKSESDARFSPDGRYLAFLSSRDGDHSQVFLIDRRGGEAQRLTDYKADVSSLAWSPDSKRLALVVSDVDPNEPKDGAKKDEDATEKPIVIHRLKFKSDGNGYLSDVRSHVYVFDVAAKSSVQVTSGAWDDDAPAWSPDGKQIAFTSNRTADADLNENEDVFVVAAAAGATARALTTGVATDAQPAWSPDGQWIAFAEGGSDVEDTIYTANHVALVPAAGGAVKPLTLALDRNVSKPRFSGDGKQVLFLLEENGEQHLARITLATGAVDRPVGGERAVYDYDLGAKGEIVVAESTYRAPTEISLVTSAGLRRLTTTNDAFVKEVALANVRKLQATSPDGTKVDFFLALPVDYKPGTRLPLLVRPHGGPAEQDAAAFDFDWHYYASHGYAVVMPNYRGSTGYGKAHSRAIWAAWGDKDLMDVIASVDHVIAMGIADPERLGVGGWSYGGYLTNYAITKTSRFKAAVSGASGFAMLANYGTDDLQYWWEKELGLPWKNAALWNKLSPIFDVEKVTTPTLVLCGAADMRVPLLNSEQLYQSLKRRGVDTELVIYPGQYHSIRTPSYRKDRLERSLAWYDRLLKPAGGTSAAAR
jgi:dipeptidyl aminopeptidase/acylaminoacyl peptidase